jgi:hypothetical protein
MDTFSFTRIRRAINCRSLIKNLRHASKYSARWDVNDLGTVEMQDGSMKKFVFFWPYGWDDKIAIPANKLDKVLEATSIDDIYELERR